MMHSPTLLRVLLERQGWDSWNKFEVHFNAAARRTAEQLGNARLSHVTTSRITFLRWLAGEQVPRGDAATVLEHMLGVDAASLLRPAPTREVVPARQPHDASLAAARNLDAGWASSSLSPAAPEPDLGGVWQLRGRHVFDGTQVPVQLYEAAPDDDVVLIGRDDHAHLRTFVQPARRALLLASLGASGGDGLYVMDAAHARRHLAVEPVEVVPIPAAYRIDDLTYGIVWAMLNLEDALLADDHMLDAEQPGLEQYLAMPRSAISRSAVPELSNIGAAWLGSRFCFQHVTRQLRDTPEPPMSWMRLRRGEEAAAWVFFRAGTNVSEAPYDRFAGASPPVGCALCVPEAIVKESERYERILVFLAAALLEFHGVTVWLCAEPDYSQLDEFTLVPDRRAVVANWLRTNGIWHVDTVDHRTQLRTYTQAMAYASTHSAIEGPTPAARLRALANYLGLDWSWLVERCREVGGYGVGGMLRPRSRLIGVDGLDRALRFVGGIDRV
jgi:hypothetical protein